MSCVHASDYVLSRQMESRLTRYPHLAAPFLCADMDSFVRIVKYESPKDHIMKCGDEEEESTGSNTEARQQKREQELLLEKEQRELKLSMMLQILHNLESQQHALYTYCHILYVSNQQQHQQHIKHILPPPKHSTSSQVSPTSRSPPRNLDSIRSPHAPSEEVSRDRSRSHKAHGGSEMDRERGVGRDRDRESAREFELGQSHEIPSSDPPKRGRIVIDGMVVDANLLRSALSGSTKGLQANDVTVGKGRRHVASNDGADWSKTDRADQAQRQTGIIHPEERQGQGITGRLISVSDGFGNDGSGEVSRQEKVVCQVLEGDVGGGVYLDGTRWQGRGTEDAKTLVKTTGMVADGRHEGRAPGNAGKEGDGRRDGDGRMKLSPRELTLAALQKEAQELQGRLAQKVMMCACVQTGWRACEHTWGFLFCMGCTSICFEL